MQNISGNLIEILSRMAFPKNWYYRYYTDCTDRIFCIPVYGMD